MSQATKGSAEKAPNYSASQVQAIMDFAAENELNMESCKALGVQLGKSYRSIIAKAKTLELTYVAKPAPAKKPRGITKAETVDLIAAVVKVDSLTGMEKASMASLNKLLAAVEALATVAETVE